jgi:hypothetical protein
LKFECLKKASVIVRAGQVVPALLTNQLAPFRLKPLGTNRAITHGVLNVILLLTRIFVERATLRFGMHHPLHGSTFIA